MVATARACGYEPTLLAAAIEANDAIRTRGRVQEVLAIDGCKGADMDGIQMEFAR
jgi:hypothetical protein